MQKLHDTTPNGITTQRTGSLRASPVQRMMFYCHDSMGVGHLRRGIVICDHLAHRFPKASFLLATGTPYVPMFKLPDGVDYVKLPALAKNPNGTYHSKHLGLRVRQLLKCRRALLLATVQSFQPSVFVVDKTPVGVCQEMIPTLKWIQRNCPQTRVVFGMRDIEDAPAATIRQWCDDGVPAVLEECFDEIWVYGSQSVYDVVREYRLPAALRDKLRYIGYIGREPCSHYAPATNGCKDVLVTVGGGTDGESLLLTYLADAAHRIAENGGHSTIVGGPDLPDHAANGLRRAIEALPDTTWIDHTECMSCLMRCADVVVSMGGYNTLCEIASFRKPALIVPRVAPRYEQAIRATRWQRLGLLKALHPASLTPQKLTHHVLQLLDDPKPPDHTRLDMRGLDRIAERFESFWSGAKRTGAERSVAS